MMALDWTQIWPPLALTLQVAGVTTGLLLLLGTPLALGLARCRSGWKPILEAVVALPLVLPSTVLGFYLLILLAPDSALGQLLSMLGLPALVFSFAGLVVASMLYSLPFTVQPLVQGFEQVGQRPFEVAATLGASPWDRFVSVLLPLSRRHYLLAATLTFAHTMGEFGVVLMVGGNIPGVTQVASIAVYEHVEALEYAQAHQLSAILLILSVSILWAVYALNRRLNEAQR